MKRIQQGLVLAACLLCALPVMAAGTNETKTDGKPVIAVSIVPEETFVKAVCADAFDVLLMIPPGASPETYEPTVKQKAALEKADLYLAIGVPAENAVLPSVTIPVVKLQDKVREQYPDLQLGEERDPHIWLSVRRVKVMVDAIQAEASRLMPGKASEFQKNAEAFKQQLSDADAEIRASLSGTQGKSFIVFHPAFGYFADEYGLTQYALEEEGKEATPKHMREMVDLARKDGAKVIFYQAEVDNRQSVAFAEEIGGVTVKLEPLAADYLDNLHRMAEAFRDAAT
jgi:zinc transport system substrate-binding protein